MQLNDEFYTKFQVVVVHLVFLSLDKGYKPPTPPFGNRFALERIPTYDPALSNVIYLKQLNNRTGFLSFHHQQAARCRPRAGDRPRHRPQFGGDFNVVPIPAPGGRVFA